MSIEFEELKVCSHCKTYRSRSEYSKKSDALDGLQSWCKPCMKNRPERRPKNFYYKPLNNHKLDLLIQSIVIYHKFYRE